MPTSRHRIELAAENVEAIAVCFLHSYANPAHERRAGEIRKARPDLFVTLSHEILREYREYERTSTTALNAFVGPRVGGYLPAGEFPARGRLRRQDPHHALQWRRHVDRPAQEQPVSMMESGPVAGMIGAGRLAKLLGLDVRWASTWAAPPPRRA